MSIPSNIRIVTVTDFKMVKEYKITKCHYFKGTICSIKTKIFRIIYNGYRTKYTQYWILDLIYYVLDTRYCALDPINWMLENGVLTYTLYWILDTRNTILDTGYWVIKILQYTLNNIN